MRRASRSSGTSCSASTGSRRPSATPCHGGGGAALISRRGSFLRARHDRRRLADRGRDDLLSLVFTACHPVLSAEARVALTLRVLGGLKTDEIARAYLVSESTIAQRIGDDWIRPALCEEALRLGRILAELAPREPEVHGLVGLMEIQASRLGTRTGPAGEPILLLDQDRARWNQLLIRRGLVAVERCQAVGGAPGPYGLQAAIAACHARASTAEQTDWVRISAHYAALAQLTPSPVVELNRAVAVSMAFGPAAGLGLVDELT